MSDQQNPLQLIAARDRRIAGLEEALAAARADAEYFRSAAGTLADVLSALQEQIADAWEANKSAATAPVLVGTFAWLSEALDDGLVRAGRLSDCIQRAK